NPSYFKFTGMFWEVLCPLLKKYAPEKFKELERRQGPFGYFDENVREEIDYKNDILNFMAALRYMNERIDMMYTPDDIHYIEIDGDDYPYMPNQWLDKDFILGRGDWFD
ncbi:MAG: hypothetical protein JW866_11180, partial [Ignavibacteriales bacterium]|nr:hypothetical protein [Ignavibacteriales bacterium]